MQGGVAVTAVGLSETLDLAGFDKSKKKNTKQLEVCLLLVVKSNSNRKRSPDSTAVEVFISKYLI